ncbi:leucine-rich repeat domain-containing protein [Ruminococcaceae bacterium OttesenSCG-928-L11]|nr:leucine-rich repeat domain-containing protein [Ruminococcaceae bacterium OttesenSCG-928-L11]
MAAIVIALAAGLMIGREQGFRQGVDSIMDIPVDKNRPFTHEELNQPITFENRYIDLAVRNALSKMPGDVINLSEVVSIDTIRIFGTHILHPELDTQLVKTHIAKGAVAYATSDGFPIDIRGDISDLSSIPNFYYLRNLTLTSQAVSDLSPLAGMKLEEISLADNFVGNLLPLKDMATLRKLDICQNPLGDLTPISRLLSLEYLDISQTQVTDLRPLTGLTKLQTLRMSYCDVSDISVLAELPNLAEVDISHTFVTDLTPLLGRASPITITCAGIPDEVVAQVRGVENVIVSEE